MKSTTRIAFVGTLLSLCWFAVAPMVARAQADPGVAADIQELKKGQQEIKQQLEEIKKLLTPKPPQAQIEKIDAVVSIGDLPPKGKKNAPVTLIEFSDYQCPFCKRQAEQTDPELIKAYVDTGKVRFVFRDFPLVAIHPFAAKAAEAARCAGEQGKYWEMHDRLFANQKELQSEKLPEHAKAVGLDDAKFRECLASGRHAAAVQRDLDEGTKLGIRGTPTVIVGTSDGSNVKNAVIIRGAQAVETFKAELDKLLVPPPKK